MYALREKSVMLQYLEIQGPEFESRYWAVYSCSAMTGKGLKEGFDWLVEHTYVGMEYLNGTHA